MESRTRSLPHGLIVFALLVVSVWGLWAGRTFFVPVLLSAMVACTAVPLVRLFKQRGVPEWGAIFAATLILAAVGLGTLFMVVRQMQAVAADVPTLLPMVEALLRRLSHSQWVHSLGLEEKMNIDSLAQHLGQSAGHGLEVAMAGARALLETGTEGALIFGFAVFMLISRRHLRHAAEEVLERWEGVEGRKVLDAILMLIERFLIAKLVVAGAIGVVSALGLALIGYPYSLLLGFLAGVGTFIPEVGFVATLVPLALVGLVTGASWGMVIAAFTLFIVVHLVEANYCTPILVGKQVNVNALATFIGLFAGGLLWGVGGMVLSLPILAVLRIAMGVSPAMQPWAKFLSERDDSDALERLVGDRIRTLWSRNRKPPSSPPAPKA